MLSCIIPAHNEERRISKTIEEFCTFFPKEEIIVSLNACTDGTLNIVKGYETAFPNLKHIESDLGAKGAAVLAGFRVAQGDYISFVDADCSTSAEEFYKMFRELQQSNLIIDGIIASRYMKDSVVSPKQSFKRILVSRIFNAFVNIMLGLGYKDTQCGAKIFKKEAVQKVLPQIRTNKWAVDIDLLYHLKKDGFKVLEFPTVWSDAEYSTLNVASAGPNMLLAVARLRLLYSPLKFIVSIYDWIKR
jgi:glycosyltransferase involved in cell wall biosynthesis